MSHDRVPVASKRHTRHAIAFLFVQMGRQNEPFGWAAMAPLKRFSTRCTSKTCLGTTSKRYCFMSKSACNKMRVLGQGQGVIGAACRHCARGSEIERLVTEYAETRYSVDWSTGLVIHYCQENQLPPVTKSAVYSCFPRVRAKCERDDSVQK